MEEKNPFKFYSVIDCDLCNCTGQIITLDEFEFEEKKDCPACCGKGAIHVYK